LKQERRDFGNQQPSLAERIGGAQFAHPTRNWVVLSPHGPPVNTMRGLSAI
jgi:hypothetical protein